MKNRVAYLVNVKKNKQAARNVMLDYKMTREILSTVAASLKNPESNRLRERRLKRINFQKHDYFMLYRIDGDVVTVTNIFHALEDYENNLS